MRYENFMKPYEMLASINVFRVLSIFHQGFMEKFILYTDIIFHKLFSIYSFLRGKHYNSF